MVLERFNVTLNELRVKDVLLILTNLGEMFESGDFTTALEQEKPLILSIAAEFTSIDNSEFTLADITTDDIERLFKPFEDLNRAFFTGDAPGESKVGAKNPPQDFSKFVESVRSSIVHVVASGHGAVLDYPWSLYSAVVKTINEQNSSEES